MTGIESTLRDAEPGDLDEVLALNRGAVPHVNDIPRSDLEWFLAQAHYFRVLDGAGIEAFLIGLERGAAYDSPNYRFFERYFDRHSERQPASFLYVDRIVVAPHAWRRGHGRRLYDDFIAEAKRRGLGFVTCEVNVRPRNDGSLRFHERMGFEEVGRQETEGGTKEVALLKRSVSGGE